MRVLPRTLATKTELSESGHMHRLYRFYNSFLPLFQDATNPSLDQGWHQGEREGLAGRSDANALLGLALIHHLAIGRNVPLAEVISWLVEMAQCGVIEFVPKTESMIKRMLKLREDIFDSYNHDSFVEELKKTFSDCEGRGRLGYGPRACLVR